MKIAILTSGGDAPGMNAVIVNLIHDAFSSHHEVFLIDDGYEGLLDNKFSLVKNSTQYDEYLNKAGSFIYCSRSPRFINEYHLGLDNLSQHSIDYLIVIGGNGSYKGTQLLASGIKTIFIPASIDNDVDFSSYSIGFASATQEIVQQSRKLISTFKTHKNIIFLEVMGRYCPDLAIAASNIIHPALTLTRKNKLSISDVVQQLTNYYQKHQFALVIVSEYVYSQDETNQIISMTQQSTGCQARWNVLGYVQRGADVCQQDINAAKQMAQLAINQINQGNSNVAIYYANDGQIKASPYNQLNVNGREIK